MAAFSKYYPFFKKADKNMLKVFPAQLLQHPDLQRHLVRSRFRELPHSDASVLMTGQRDAIDTYMVTGEEEKDVNCV